LETKPVINVSRSGPDGNVFVLMQTAIRALKDPATRVELETALKEAIHSNRATYEDVCRLIEEYVHIEWQE